MQKLLVNYLRKLQNYLSKWTNPQQDELVLALILQTSKLELSKGDYVELAPMIGCCGPFRLSGNSLPVFEYTVFDKPMMEFVRIRVEISRPSRIEYVATIDSIKTRDSKRHGEIVPVTDKYKQPFEKLAWHLYCYFPFFLKQTEPSLVRKTIECEPQYQGEEHA